LRSHESDLFQFFGLLQDNANKLQLPIAAKLSIRFFKRREE
jgi:hypothetical protein